MNVRKVLIIILLIASTIGIINIHLMGRFTTTGSVQHRQFNQCHRMYKETGKKLVQTKKDSRRSPPFWSARNIKENHLFVRNMRHFGRLGNKLFETAAVFGVAKQNNRTPSLIRPTWKMINQYFDTRIVLSNPVENKSNWLPYYDEKFYNSPERKKKLPQRNLTIGRYLILLQYFKDSNKDLRRELQFKKSLLYAARLFLRNNSISLKNESTFVRVVIHVRRGDLRNKLTKYTGFLGLDSDYFSRSKDYFRKCYERVQFVVVSDDIAWCKENIVGIDVIYSERFSPGGDLALCSMCDHAIITYGTFSSWCAWFANGVTVGPLTLALPNSKSERHFKAQAEYTYPYDIVRI